jgi:enoyl-CoA hydratase
MAASNREDDVVLIQRITLPKSQKIAVLVTINRADKTNSFNTRVCHTLAQIFHDLADEIQSYDLKQSTQLDDESDKEINSVAAVVFTGAGSSFCAGADLSDPPNPLHQSSDLPHYLRWNPVYQMSRIGVPIIGALKGHVITGGFELALACDILIGEPTTKFRDTHVKFGLAPCWGLSQKLSQRIGPGRAKMVSFSAMPIKADVAYDWGLLDEIAVSSTARAIELADSIGTNDPVMVRRYKRAIVEGMDVTGLRRERELGLAHYLEIVGDGTTFEGAKEFISDDSRPRMQSKL